MKKIVITIAAMLLITSLTACSGSSGESDNTSVATTGASTSTQTEKTVAAESTKGKEPIKDEDLLTTKFPLVKKYVDGPRWQIVEKGYTKLYNINDRKFIALTTNDELSVSKPSEVLDTLLKDFQQGTDTMCGSKGVLSYDIMDTKEMTINGTDYVRYQGYLVCQGYVGNDLKKFNCYFVGYTFICEKDGKNVPCQMIGAVVSDEQEQSDIDEITKYTDAMVYTIRNTRKIQ